MQINDASRGMGDKVLLSGFPAGRATGGHMRAQSQDQITVRRTASASVISVPINQIAFDAPWNWLASGWRDLWAAPRVSLTYGAVFAALSIGLTLGLMMSGLASLVLALAGGFLLIGPIAAVGLYESSRRLEAGEDVRLRDVQRAGAEAPGQLGFFGAILAFAYLVWVQIAFLLFMLFLDTNPLPPPSQFLPTLLFTPRGLGLLVAGTIVGGMLALLVFSVSAISVPLLLTRRLDAVTAINASLSSVRRNPKPMLLWAGLIAGFMALGIATLCIGLVLVFPLIGHATWRAFRDLVREQPDSYL